MGDLSKARVVADMKAAMKSKDKLRLATIRMLLSEFKYAEIRKGSELTEAELTDAITKEIKKRQDAVPLYRQGGRDELADKEELEQAILQAYLPAQLSESELDALVEEAVAEVGAGSLQELGKVMSVLMPRTKGRADGAVVSQKVKSRLGTSG